MPMPGDTFLLKYGESWKGVQMYIDASGTPGNPIVYGAYGNPADGKPIITTVMPLNGATNSGNWTETSLGSNIWTIPQTDSPGRLFLDGNEVLRASTLTDVGILDNENARGVWFFEAGTLYLYATQNPTNFFNSFEGSNAFYSALVFNAKHLILENLDIRGGVGAALSIFGGEDIIVQSCNLGHSSGTGVQLIDANVNNSRIPATEIIIRENTINSNFTFFYGLGSERGVGDGVRMVFGVNNCQVYNNTFLNWAHNAVELRGDQAGGSGVNNNQIYDNHISAPDIPYAHPFGLDGFLGKCQFNEIYRNYVENCRTISQINGNNNWVHHNIIRGMRTSPSKTTPTAIAFSLSIYGDNLVCENNRLDHNLIIDTDEAGFVIQNFGYPIQVKNNSIRNNIIYQTGIDPINDDYQAGTGLVIYDTYPGGIGPNTYQNNLFYNELPNAKMALIRKPGNDSYLSADEFNQQNGLDGNTISGNIEGDPLFADFDNQNYVPQFNAPVIDAGILTGLELDYAQNPRNQGLAPDIGPFETIYSREDLPALPIKANLILTFLMISLSVLLMKRTFQ